MKHTPIFSAVIGNRSTLGFFDVYADFSCVWQHGKTKVTSTVNTGTLENYLEIAQKEGMLVGISSGATCWAAKEIAERSENQGKNIVCILADTGQRYLSVDELFNQKE